MAMRIHEDSVQLEQPPRVPQAPSLSEARFHELPVSMVERGAPAVSMERPPMDPVLHRHASPQPSHFLQGFNVQDCFDVRSIPDPPSPRQRNPRRQSSPFMNPRSLEDVTNQASSEKHRLGKRSRKSLCHIPTPVFDEQRDDPALAGQEANSRTAKTLEVNICLNDDNVDHSSKKRRRKRQSMQLPTEWVEKHAATIAPPKPSKSFLPKQMPFAGDMQSMRELQQLVRGYCSLPEEERATSAKANQIEATTGYPIINTPDEDQYHPLCNSNQKSILRKLAPVIQQMDKRKVEDINKWEHETNCRVERSKTGRYRYISLSTNKKIPSKEYKVRYMAVLDREAGRRLQRTNEWKEKLVPLEEAMVATTAQTTEPDVAELHVDSSSDMDEGDDSFAVTQELDLDLSTILDMDTDKKQEQASPSSDEVEKTVTRNEVDTVAPEEERKPELPESGEPAELVSKENASSNPVSSHNGKENHDSTNDSGTVEKDNLEQKASEGALTAAPAAVTEILPLPDRSGASKDPRIAAAEKKLWHRIDTALQDYSREVVLIMQAKNTAGDNTVATSNL